jgi:hypothetical protein
LRLKLTALILCLFAFVQKEMSSAASAAAGGRGGGGGGGGDSGGSSARAPASSSASAVAQLSTERTILPLFHLSPAKHRVYDGTASKHPIVKRHAALYRHAVMCIPARAFGSSPINFGQLRLETYRMLLAMWATLSEMVVHIHAKERNEYNAMMKKAHGLLSAKREKAAAAALEKALQDKADKLPPPMAAVIADDEIDAASIREEESAIRAAEGSGEGDDDEDEKDSNALMRRLPPVHWVVETCMRAARESEAKDAKDADGDVAMREAGHAADGDGDGHFSRTAPLSMPVSKEIEIYRIHIFILSKKSDGGEDDMLARAVHGYVTGCETEDREREEKENKIHQNRTKPPVMPDNIFRARARTMEAIERICNEYDPAVGRLRSEAGGGGGSFNVFDYFTVRSAIELGKGSIRRGQSDVDVYLDKLFPFRECAFRLAMQFNINRLMSYYFPWAPGLREIHDKERAQAIEAQLSLLGVDQILSLLPSSSEKEKKWQEKMITAYLAKSRPDLYDELVRDRLDVALRASGHPEARSGSEEYAQAMRVAETQVEKMASTGAEYVRDAAVAHCKSLPSLLRKGVLTETPLLYYDDFKARLDPIILHIEETVAREEQKAKQLLDQAYAVNVAKTKEAFLKIPRTEDEVDKKMTELADDHKKKLEANADFFTRKRIKQRTEAQDALLPELRDLVFNTGAHHRDVLSDEECAIFDYLRTFLENNKGSMNMRRNPRITDVDSFVELMQTFLDIAQNAMLIVGKHVEQLFTFLSGWTVYLPKEYAVVHTTFSGIPGTGKSSMLANAIEYSIPGSIRPLQFMSPKSLHTDKEKNNCVKAYFDEAPLGSLAQDRKTGVESEATQFIKSIMTNGTADAQVLDRVDVKVEAANGAGPTMVQRRVTRKIKSQVRWQFTICMNENPYQIFVPAICDRMAIMEITERHTLGPEKGADSSTLDKNSEAFRGPSNAR